MSNITMLDVIRRGANETARHEASRLGDEQTEREHRAAARLWKAMIEMELAIDEVNTLSALVTVNEQAFKDFVHDEIPARASWSEKITAARRGWDIAGAGCGSIK